MSESHTGLDAQAMGLAPHPAPLPPTPAAPPATHQNLPVTIAFPSPSGLPIGLPLVSPLMPLGRKYDAASLPQSLMSPCLAMSAGSTPSQSERAAGLPWLPPAPPPAPTVQPRPACSAPTVLPPPPPPRPAPPATRGLSAPVDLVHGDCVAGMSKLPSGSVDLVIADPPYNIGVQGSAWDTVPNYLSWCTQWLREAVRVLRPGGALFIYGSPAKLWICHLKLLAAELGLDFKQHISWVYKQGGMPRTEHHCRACLRRAHAAHVCLSAMRPGDSRLKGMSAYSVRMEHLEWFVQPGATHTFNAEAAAEPYTEAEAVEALAKGIGRVTPEALARGRPPRNWWEIPRENSRSKERAYGVHPSMKPLKISERLVEVHSHRGNTVLIPFGGSGSECVAAAAAGRRVIAFETDAEYYQLILRRMHGHGLLPAHIPPPPPLQPAEPPKPPLASVEGAAAADAAADSSGVAGCTAAGQTGGASNGAELQRDARYASGYMGVYKNGKRWVAKVMRNGALRSLGSFNTAYEAAGAYAAECALTPDAERPGGRQYVSAAQSIGSDGNHPYPCSMMPPAARIDLVGGALAPSPLVALPPAATAMARAAHGLSLAPDVRVGALQEDIVAACVAQLIADVDAAVRSAAPGAAATTVAGAMPPQPQRASARAGRGQKRPYCGEDD